ncbi:Uridylate kinase [Elusimicrobium minutum Pei191]|uniref:Uridylate kinase n=1 Tax=Elusimicrobium minutum (strain Pei191) TaxID=445932 RepID=B2KCL6_ELUMP|nr:UMP kinase [Elusimicrobium minutum]ACC98262.1 Uridylate kinase [Elusimicrobium minutum Pei191]
MKKKSQQKRILLKLSGEALVEEGKRGITPFALKDIAKEIASASKDCQLAVVIGGGNIWRGVRDGGGIIDRVNSDNMGMLATVINALALQSALEDINIPTRVLTSINIYELAEAFIRRKAVRHLEKGRVIIFAGGTGNPFFTTDSAAALRASEIGADILLKATQVDGVYDSDPRKNPKAKLISRITYGEAISKGLQFMDTAALALCMENNLPIQVFNLHKKGNIKAAVDGKKIGTIIY